MNWKIKNIETYQLTLKQSRESLKDRFDKTIKRKRFQDRLMPSYDCSTARFK